MHTTCDIGVRERLHRAGEWFTSDGHDAGRVRLRFGVCLPELVA